MDSIGLSIFMNGGWIIFTPGGWIVMFVCWVLFKKYRAHLHWKKGVENMFIERVLKLGPEACLADFRDNPTHLNQKLFPVFIQTMEKKWGKNWVAKVNQVRGVKTETPQPPKTKPASSKVESTEGGVYDDALDILGEKK